MRANLLAAVRDRVPAEQRLLFRQRLARLFRPAWLGTLRRTSPLSDAWGYDRGTPVDRYYIECFLSEHRHDIHGHVLEVKDSGYVDRYGSAIAQRDVLDIDASNPHATIIADLSTADSIPAEQFDCFVLTQTLQFIYDLRSAIRHAYRILRPNGVLLVTMPSVSPLDRRLTDYWRLTAASCSALFGEVFGAENITVRSYGNMLAAIAFLTGMAHQELSEHELDVEDWRFPVIVAVRAVKTSREPS
jgi:SAM-dependent methyltransferase